jgi:hypothetical protein
MRLQYNDKLLIKSDESCWTMCFPYPNKKTGETEWRGEYFSPSFKTLLEALVDREIRLSTAQDLAQAVKDVQAIATHCSKVFTVQVTVGEGS